MKNLLLILISMTTLLGASAQTNIVGYQYWLNNDYANVVNVNTPVQQQVNINELINMQLLPAGINLFNIRFKDSNNLWSSTVSHIFNKLTDSHVTGNITTYQYWLNNDYANVVTVNTPVQQQVNISELINMQLLPTGINVFNIRFKDNNNLWSSTVSHIFNKIPEQNITGQNKIVAYRYWFNNDFNQAINVSLATPALLLDLTSDLNLAQIPVGEHTIHFQFKDANGAWSTVTTDTIQKTITLNIIDNTFSSNTLVYPNPTNGRVFVDFDETLNDIKVTVHNINGKLVLQNDYTNLQSLEFSFNEPSGIYLMTISSKNKRTTVRLIKY